MSPTRLALIVDDQPENIDLLIRYLESSGLELIVATSGDEALELAYAHVPDIILLDVMMPGIDGYHVCQQIKTNPQTCECPVIFLSALGGTRDKVKGFEVGAVDFITKPLQREEVLARINAHLLIRQQKVDLLEKTQLLEKLNAELQDQIDQRRLIEKKLQVADRRLNHLTQNEIKNWGIDAFIGQSNKLLQLIDDIRSLQKASNTNVLVLGESGTGKELVSRAIHFGSERQCNPFIAVNCSAIPAELADAEFFGHLKGAYTGATSDRDGYFVQADGGTLFLDEIGDMPFHLQAKLLRVLEDGMVVPLGATTGKKVNIRIVAATNVNLQENIRKKLFRQDFFYRIAGYQITLPTLKERTSDIPLLAEHFLNKLAGQMGRDHVTISASAMDALSNYDFPGNVRELKNMMEYALIASRGRMIDNAHLHFQKTSPANSIEAVTKTNPSAENTDNNSAHITDHEAPSSLLDSTISSEHEILTYVKENGRIDNSTAQSLLGVDHARASYLLKKLHKEGNLEKQGQRRWTWYALNAQR